MHTPINTLCGRLLLSLAEAVAWVVSLRRELVRHKLTDDECEAAGVPYGSTEKAIYSFPINGASWWHFAIYVDGSAGEGWIELRAFGWSAEVFYVRRSTGEPVGAV